ncbi:hypothetical protein MC7420_5404 [Coleofasciculus chthonoplastes PCC 7420]|uniref:Uncharacterized protein n=1 Tax=Coleofasciculus chthonoplastes PCC 7420 TaxID=118168 RepID=B4VP95_9CYAN|nr:hypothetical protein MC7420_5404 [Coleofasciculus chthonoplastes PCC 7420]
MSSKPMQFNAAVGAHRRAPGLTLSEVEGLNVKSIQQF